MSNRTIRPRRGDLEAACTPHESVPSGEYAGMVEVCDLCGFARANIAIHTDAWKQPTVRRS